MHGIARFATFELDLLTGELRNRGIRLRLRRQSAEILEMLIARYPPPRCRQYKPNRAPNDDAI
jgi:hypothetical protein